MCRFVFDSFYYMMLKATETRMQAVIFHWFKVLLQNKEIV
jgi:hypothetical protein